MMTATTCHDVRSLKDSAALGCDSDSSSKTCWEVPVEVLVGEDDFSNSACAADDTFLK